MDKKRSTSLFKKHTPHLDSYLSIIRQVKENGCLPKLDMPKNTMQYYINVLKRHGAIYKIGYAVWAVDEKKYESTLQALGVTTQHTPLDSYLYIPATYKPTERSIRSHAFVFTARLPKIKNWEKRIAWLKKKDIEYTPIPQGERIIINKHKVWLTNNSIVVYFNKDKDYLVKTANGGLQRAIADYKVILRRIENMMGLDLRYKGRYFFRVSRQHHAFIKNELARKCNDERKRLLVADESGTWLITDDSYRLDELEGVHKESSPQDMDGAVVPFFNSLKKYHEDTGESPSYINMMKVMDFLVTDRFIYAENLKSHVGAIQTMAKKLEELTDMMKRWDNR